MKLQLVEGIRAKLTPEKPKELKKKVCNVVFCLQYYCNFSIWCIPLGYFEEDALSVEFTLGLRSKKLWYLNLSSRTSFSFTSCSIRDLEESNHLQTHSVSFQLFHWQTTTDFMTINSLNKPLRQVNLTPGWFWLCPAGTGACTFSPGFLVRRLAGWQRGYWDCLQTVGYLQTKQRWVRVGCRP